MFIVCSCSFSLCKIIHPVEMDPKTFVQPCISRTSSGNTGTVILGRYEIGRLLGRGSFAKVYQGRALSDDIPVAIKVIEKPPPMEAASMEPRIVREVSAMRRLNPHPNILKLHEVMATKTKIYLVMELAPGGELFAKLSRRGRFTEPAARRYFQQLVSALHFCHQNGVAHRDVKPQNLLLDQLGNLKVSDFGLSALPEQINNGMLHTACGTPAYTAPEVVRRKGYDGPKADAWSCGIILFVFLAGQLPFDDSNLPNMYRKIHYREFEIPDWVSKPARYIIQRLLDPNPSTRMSIEGLMGLAWFKKSLQLQPQCSHIGLEECKDEKGMNAFDIISMSSGLDLSGLFEANLSQKERRFPSGEKVEVIEESVKQVGGRLGYRVEKGKGGVIGLVKEKTVLLVKIMEVTGELSWVELKVVGEIGGVEWEELRVGLEDMLVPLHNESC